MDVARGPAPARSLITRIGTGLHRYDPWRRWYVAHAQAPGPVRSTQQVEWAVLAAALSAVLAVVVLVNGAWGWAITLIGAASALVIWGWTAATFTFEQIEAVRLRPGLLLSDSCGRTGPNGELQYAGVGTRIAGVFVHHGSQSTAVWVGLVSGLGMQYPRDAQVRVAFKRDWFSACRPIDTSEPPPIGFSSELLTVLAQIWDRSGSDGCVDVADLDDGLSAALDESVNRRLIKLNRRHGRTSTAELTFTGVVVLAAELRAGGIEIFDDAEAPQMTNITNYGNWFDHSPGAAGVVGTGDASGGNGTVSGTGTDLDALLAAIRDVLPSLDVPTQDVLEQSAVTIEQELAAQEPDDGRVKGAVRVALRFGGDVLVGALGSGTWQGLATWAGVD